jgi:hypothetical protein
MDGTAPLLYQLFLPVLLALTGRAVATRGEGGFGAAGSAIGMACGEFVLLLGVLAGPVTLSGSSDLPPVDTHTVGYGPGGIAALAGVALSIVAALVARISRPAWSDHPSATNDRETPSRNADDLTVSAIDTGETI